MSRYISKVADALQGKLPPLVTKEELMNFYLHEMNKNINNFTVVNLVQAANLVNIKVKGKSRLEIIVPLKEQWRFMMEEVKATTNKKAIREKLMLNKEDIIAAYEGGESIKGLAESWSITPATMRRYLTEFGVEFRKGNFRSLKTYSSSVTKKKGRKQRAE